MKEKAILETKYFRNKNGFDILCHIIPVDKYEQQQKELIECLKDAKETIDDLKDAVDDQITKKGENLQYICDSTIYDISEKLQKHGVKL